MEVLAARRARRATALREALDGVRDLERLAGRAAAGRATPRELGALRDSFARLPDVLEALDRPRRRADASAAARRARRATSTSWPTSPRELARGARATGRPRRSPTAASIRAGFDAELDELRELRDGGRRYIAALQQRERERTGIASLKVGFNKVFGYYLEVTHAHPRRVPADYERRQTLAGAERYVTPELKEYEEKVLGAEERMATREAELFDALRAARRRRRSARIQETVARARAARRAGRARRVRGARAVRPPRGRTTASTSRLAGRRHPVVERHDAARDVHPERRRASTRRRACCS